MLLHFVLWFLAGKTPPDELCQVQNQRSTEHNVQWTPLEGTNHEGHPRGSTMTRVVCSECAVKPEALAAEGLTVHSPQTAGLQRMSLVFVCSGFVAANQQRKKEIAVSPFRDPGPCVCVPRTTKHLIHVLLCPGQKNLGQKSLASKRPRWDDVTLTPWGRSFAELCVFVLH